MLNHTVSKNQMRLLLVDDQPGAVGYINDAISTVGTLQLLGCAESLDDALQLCRMTKPDAVLISLESSSLDGLAILQEIALRWPAVRMLVLAGPEREDQLRRALDAGAAGYLPRDVAPVVFAGALAHMLESRKNDVFPGVSVSTGTVISLERTASVPRAVEMAEAARIQSSFLPADPPPMPGWELAVAFQPARETSGDFYDFIPLDHGKLGIVVADVSDKGLGAALFMAMTSTLFRTYTLRHPTLPGLTLSTISERILSDTGGSSFVTAFLGILEPNTGRLRYANAGHIPPLMISPRNSKSIDRLVRTGLAMGIMPYSNWGQKIARFMPGDFLLLYTDGVLDAQNRRGEYFGDKRLQGLARSLAGASAAEVRQVIQGELAVFTADMPANDDMIIMVIARKR